MVALDKEEENDPVYITKLIRPWEDREQIKDIIKELKLLRILDCDFVLHPFQIVQVDRLEDFEAVYIIQQFTSTTLRQQMQQPIDPATMQFYFYELFLCLDFLHQSDVFMGTLSPEAILITQDQEVRINNL